MQEIDRNRKVCINLPDKELAGKLETLKPSHLRAENQERLAIVNEEMIQTFEFIKKYPKSVSFFGSARTREGDEHYEQARRIASRVCNEGYAVVTGGGPGIMEAANRGAKEACGMSIGFNIELPEEQNVNPYVTHGLGYHYFFTRKVALAFSAEVYMFFPGGYGTLDELFEILTLVQTEKIQKVPIILVGEDYWRPLDKHIKSELLDKHATIDASDMDLYKITDNEDEIVKIVHDAKLRDE